MEIRRQYAERLAAEGKVSSPFGYVFNKSSPSARLGREEMAYLTMNWTKLSGQDFIVMKARLQV